MQFEFAAVAVAALLIQVAGVSDARTARSHAALSEFKSTHHCPATSKPRGACPGWVIDHIIALACGGMDDATNMQWQTVSEARDKDRWERIGCTNKSKGEQ